MNFKNILSSAIKLIKNFLPEIGINITTLNKPQNNNLSQIIANSGNNPTFNLNTSAQQDPYILNKMSEVEKLIKIGVLNSSEQPSWRWTKSNINPVITKDGKYVAIKPRKELWLTYSIK